MFVFIGIGIFTLVVAYIVYTIAFSSSGDGSDTSFDAFIDPSLLTSISKTEVEEASASQDAVAASASVASVAARRTDSRFRKPYTEVGRQMLIFYGTEYGFSKELARELFDRVLEVKDESGQSIWQPRCVNARHFSYFDLTQESILLVIISTAGDGVPPSEARDFVNWLMKSDTQLPQLSFSVLALGDSSYLHFCRAGELVDTRMAELGARRFVTRRDVDAEDRQTIENWFNDVLGRLPTINVEPKLDYITALDFENSESSDLPSREKPFLATLKVKYNLTAVTGNDDKETIHCEFDISGSGLQWSSGDAVGIYPLNNANTVRDIINLAQWSPSTLVDVPLWAYKPVPEARLPLETVLLSYCDLKIVKPELLLLLCHHSPEGSIADSLKRLLQEGLFKTNTVLSKYISAREVVDVVGDFHTAVSSISPGEFVQHLRALQPRYYSISSSPLVDPNTVCVTAAVIRYESLERVREGVTTTYLQDRLAVGQNCPVFISRNPDFRLPSDGSVPIIMVGPGTGLAPFRAFIQERVLGKASGKMLLYFGCRRKEQDFIYRQELERWTKETKLKLRTAFSRDNTSKVYVQDLIRNDASDIWNLLNDKGAHLYICGDARRMAMDVHRAILDITIDTGGLDPMEAIAFLSELESTGRYQKDVWVT